MVVSEWEGTAWAGSAAVAESSTTGHNVRMIAKAAQGWEPIWNPSTIPWFMATRSPLRRMQEDQAAYWINPWILTAENAVTRRVRGLPWHLEDQSNEEIDDENLPAALRPIQELLEKPQAALPIEERQVGISSWTNLISITSRHLGLCGMTHWFKDQMDANGTPAAIVYVNPARLYPITTSTGHLVEWSLDPKDDQGRGGTRIRRDQIITFYLTPPDGGAIVTGLVHAARVKSMVTNAADMHALNVLSSGGRIAGFVSPKNGVMEKEQAETLERELRSIQDAPDSAKRLQLIKGPIDFQPTSANMQELDLAGLSSMNRDDILTVWGVPASQAPVAIAAGMNSGDTKGYDEAILYQGAVHDRIAPIRETVQFELLDLYPEKPELVIEEPTFDDEAPAYELAVKAKDQPLTRNERRALLGKDPLPDYGPDGEPLGLAIDLPAMIVTVGQGEDTPGAKPGNFTKAPEPTISVLPPSPPLLPGPSTGAQDAPAKADIRAATVRKFEPVIRRAVQAFLDDQKAEIAAKVREKGEHIARKPSDTDAWWSGKWDAKLMEALRRGLAGVTETVATRIGQQVPAKADPFAEAVLQALLRTVAKRVTGINTTTRDAIASIIGKAFSDGLSPAQVADLITEATPFDTSRAEVIARTETAYAYNGAAVESYREVGVEKVEVIDGDGDDECQAADGQVWTLDEANDNPLGHPNCVRDFAPVFGGA
jgi:hypothetical protein